MRNVTESKRKERPKWRRFANAKSLRKKHCERPQRKMLVDLLKKRNA